MSFSSDAKQELTALPARDECCARAELAGLILSGERQDGILIETEHDGLARRACMLARTAAEFSPRLRTLIRRRFGKRPFYQAVLDENEAKRLFSLLPHGTHSRECCRRAYLRGTFLACGTVADPGKGYHIEWRFLREEYARELQKAMRKYAPNASISKRGCDHIVYCKGAEQIADLFRAMGAASALLHLENVRIYKDMRNQANRIVNCESANVDKVTRAAQSQIESIRYLEEHGVLKSLPKELLEAAEMRVSYPEATLEELGDLLLKPIGKSGINHRMRKLTALARSMREKESTAW